MPTIALQPDNAPTNKLSTGTNVAGGVGGVLAGVLAAYGGDAIKEVLANVPFIGPAMTNLIVMALVGVATWWGSSAAGRMAAYNVLDKPNIPIG